MVLELSSTGKAYECPIFHSTDSLDCVDFGNARLNLEISKQKQQINDLTQEVVNKLREGT